jgi:hypothetical protein
MKCTRFFIIIVETLGVKSLKLNYQLMQYIPIHISAGLAILRIHEMHLAKGTWLNIFIKLEDSLKSITNKTQLTEFGGLCHHQELQ